MHPVHSLSWRQHWHRFTMLGLSDQALFLKLCLLLILVSSLLRLLDYPRTHRLLTRFIPSKPIPLPGPNKNAFYYAKKVGSLSRIAGSYLPVNSSCLRQSLLVWWLLRRRGLLAKLCIGVSKHQGFSAHAWVELDGYPINDNADISKYFAAFDRVN